VYRDGRVYRDEAGDAVDAPEPPKLIGVKFIGDGDTAPLGVPRPPNPLGLDDTCPFCVGFFGSAL